MGVLSRIPCFENSFWIYLPNSIITVDVEHRQPIQAIFSWCCFKPSLEAPKTYHMHMNRLVMLDVALKSHEHLGMQVSVSIRYWVCNGYILRIFTTHLSTSCWRSFGYGKWFMYMYSVFISLTISDLHYLQAYQMIAVENCFQFLGKSRI